MSNCRLCGESIRQYYEVWAPSFGLMKTDRENYPVMINELCEHHIKDVLEYHVRIHSKHTENNKDYLTQETCVKWLALHLSKKAKIKQETGVFGYCEARVNRVGYRFSPKERCCRNAKDTLNGKYICGLHMHKHDKGFTVDI